MLRLGLPQWNHPQWRGAVYPPRCDVGECLHYYSRAFDAVEGNTTFYALPNETTVARWKEQTAESFRFCFKLPQGVTHRSALRHCDTELNQFFQRLSPLAQRLGPFMVQLPAEFGPPDLPVLDAFLKRLPAEFEYAVEVRHPGFFAKGDAERQLNRLLLSRQIDRVCFDSRALFSVPPVSDAEIDAQRKKPQLPVHAIATGPRPLLRLIGHSDTERSLHYWQPWLGKLSQWLEQGLAPYVFVHAPDNGSAPRQAEQFYQALAEKTGLPERAPVETQVTLF